MRHLCQAILILAVLAVKAAAGGPTAQQLQGVFAAGSGAIGQLSGDVSGASALAAGSPMPRSLSVRLGETLDVADYGASCNGVTDDTAAVLAAQAAGRARGSATIVIPPGCGLSLSSTVFTVSSNAWSWGAGSYVAGAGGVQGLLITTQNNMQTWSRSSSFAGNENGLAVSTLFNPVTGTVNYQKNGLFVRTYQVDPSSYSDPQTILAIHDAVGIESQAGIIQGNPTGRAWAYHGACSVDPVSEGQCIAGEFEIYNSAGYEPLSGRFDTKMGLHVDAMGTSDSTVAIQVAGAQHWKTGLDLLQQSLRTDGDAWRLDRPDGSALANLSSAGNITAQVASFSAVSSQGQVSVSATPGLTSPNTDVVTATITNASGAIEVGRLSAVNSAGTGTLGGSGHLIGQLGEVNFSNANSLPLAIGVEGVVNVTGTGTVSNVFGVVSHLVTNYGSVGLYDGFVNVGVDPNGNYQTINDLDCPNLGAMPHLSGARTCILNRDPLKSITSAGQFINSTGQELVPASPGIATGRFYYGENPGAIASPISGLSSRMMFAPFGNPARTTYSRIGISVSTSVSGATCSLDVYVASNGVPSGAPLLAAPVTVAAGQAGNAEAAIQVTLDGGFYFPVVSCSSDQVAITSYLEKDAGRIAGGGSSAGGDTALIATNLSSFPSNPVISYTNTGDQMPQIWLRK